MRKMAENTLNREMKFVLRWKICAMSVLHFGGERAGSIRGQGVPRAYREVQTRVIRDAIVSNKTFRNATFQHNCLQNFLATSAANLVQPSKRSNKTFIWCFNGKDEEITDKFPRSLPACIFDSICTRQRSKDVMPERIEKFKDFFTKF